MVFSFFKKTPEKMLVRPAAVPARPAEKPAPAAPPAAAATPTPAAEGMASAAPVASPSPPSPPASRSALAGAGTAAALAAGGSSDFSDFSFSDAAGGVLLDDAIDPVDADAEQGAMLWANAQVEAARAFLEDSVRVHRFGPGERLWLMLFDLYRLSGRSAEFEALGIDYAQAFEKSPPIWRGARPAAVEPPPLTARPLPLSGALQGSDAPALQALAAALQKSPRIVVDAAALAAGDAAGHGALLALLAAARRAGGDIVFIAAEALADALARCVAQGRTAGAESWLLLLELQQQLGREADFEETAIAYAVTFEISPPSWERRPAPAAAAAKSVQAAAGGAAAAAPGEALAGNAADGEVWRLAGDLRNVRFAELARFAAGRDSVLIDCAQLARIDFVSAGALFNTLEGLRRAGKRVIFRQPNHLVSELLAVFGVPALAEIVSSQS